MAKLTYAPSIAAATRADHVVLFAPKRALDKGLARKVFKGDLKKQLDAMVEDAKPGAMGAVVSSYTGGRAPKRVTLAVLPDSVARHVSPTRAHAIHSCAGRAGLNGEGSAAAIFYLDEPSHYTAAAVAVARVLPLFDQRSKGQKGSKKAEGSVALLGIDAEGHKVKQAKETEHTVAAARWAAELVDTPTADMTTADFVAAARKATRGIPNVKVSAIIGDALVKKGLMGIHSVGRTAVVAPRLLVMQYTPRGADLTVALVGKGVVYDTGGLSIKTGGHMAGMKADMGGGAAVAGAFVALARSKVKRKVVCLVPLAENAVGPDSYRPDDILTMHSGKTVEINNTDAEGRLLLADGVSYAQKTFKPDVVIDAATLTGAQLLATGKRHGAVITNRDGVEARAVEAGRRSGDLVHPLPFAPEFYQSEFKSECADMKNSVKDRMNAQTSCAAQFVWSHISESGVPWLHVDIAGPAFPGRRATGFGVALLADLVTHLAKKDLKR